ncbi:PEP-CTERM sorting domain-containing protein [Aquabacterium sp.]|uniref:PEP-CTERM sorting domain-containing protein n=1 Tax=Aquabacterium sp. TaxID=1872578 RepID=UPI0035AEA3AB
MNFKALAAAAALVAAAPSFALTLGTASTGSSVFLNVVEENTTQTSYELDLNLSVATFNDAGTYSWTLTGDTWNTFLATVQAGGDMSSLQWSVNANKLVNAGQQFVYTTAADGTLASDLAVRNSAVVGIVNDVTSYEQKINSNLDATGLASTAGSTSPAYWAYSENDTLNSKLNSSVMNSVGTASSLYKIAVTPKTAGGATYFATTLATVTASAGSFNLTNTAGVYTLTYTQPSAAVPEASTLAMLLAGLGFVGFIARRRAA